MDFTLFHNFCVVCTPVCLHSHCRWYRS